jgi:hypothetical protein
MFGTQTSEIFSAVENDIYVIVSNFPPSPKLTKLSYIIFV